MFESSFEAVELTQVKYQKGDHLGHFLAWVSLIPVFISLAGFLSHLIFRRELQVLFFSIGQIISIFICVAVKNRIKQSRPPETCSFLEVCHSHGWPSNHSQFTFFFATYLTLLAIKKSGFFRRELKWGLPFLSWYLAFLTLYSRVYLGYHTLGQTIGGAAIGTFLGGVWFWVVNSVACCYFEAMEESWLGKKLCLKDTSHIDNVMKFEYINARAARKVAESSGRRS